MTNYYVSSVAYAAISTWAALTGGAATAISLGQYVRNTSPAAQSSASVFDTFKRVWKCTTAGTTSTTEPAAWSTTTPGNDGATVTDGTVVWTEVMGREAEQAAGAWHAPAPDIASMCGAKAPSAGDTFFLSSDHNESNTMPTFSTYVFSPTSARNCRFISVTRSAGSVPPVAADITSGAIVSWTLSSNTTFNGFQWAYYNGITFKNLNATGTQTMSFQGNTNINAQKCVLENCGLEIVSTGGSSQFIIGQTTSGVLVEWINTTVKMTNVAVLPLIGLASGAQFLWRDTPTNAVQGTAPTALLGTNDSKCIHATLRGLDLSGLGNNRIINPSIITMPSRVSVENCKLSSSMTDANLIFNTTGGTDDEMCFAVDNCDDTVNSRNWRMLRLYANGSVKAVSAPARSSGASDGVTGIAWQFTSISDTRLGTMNDVFVPGPKIVQRYDTTGVSKTLTVECIYNGAAKLTNAQAWFDAELLGTSGVPLSQTPSSGLATPISTPANLSVSTKTWTAPARANTHAYALGDVISVGTNVGPVFFCTTAGTSAGSEPGGFASAVDGGSVTDGTAVFRAGWRMSMSVTFTPQVKGVLRVTPKFAVSNDAAHYFLDPMLTIV